MPGLCLVLGAVRDLTPLDVLQAAAPDAEFAVEETRDDGWSLVHVRWNDFQVSLNRLEPGSEPYVAQVQGVAGLVHAAGEPTPGLYVLMARTRAARHVIGVATEPATRDASDEDRVSVVLRALLSSLNGFAVRDGCVLDAQLRLYLRPGGEPDPDAELPLLRSATARRERSLERLAPYEIEQLPDLPALLADEEALARAPEEVARRAQALWAVTVRAADLIEQKQAVDLLQKRDLWSAATPLEQEFLLNSEPNEIEILRYVSRRESLAALLWVLGHTGLGQPTEFSNLEALVRVLRRVAAPEFVGKAALRPLPEILDEADFVARCHGAVVQALVNGQVAPAGLRVSVVRERHAALHWVLRVMDQPWDEVADGRQ